MPRVDVGELYFEVEEFGDPDDPAMLLIMGLGCQMILYTEDFCRGLAEQGFRVIRFDNRDVGLSAKLRGKSAPNPLVQGLLQDYLGVKLSTPYRLGDMADDAIGIMDALGIDKAHVVGCSMGGMIAQLLGIMHPERLLSLTAMCCTSLNRDCGRPRRCALAAIARNVRRPSCGREQFIQEKERLLRFIAGKNYPPDKELLTLIGACYDRDPEPEGAQRQLAAILAEDALSERLRSVEVPLLVINGDRDPLAPLAGAKDIADNAAKGTLHVVPGMGHSIPRPLYDEFFRVIADHARQAVASSQMRDAS